jgi:hypothetical protein
MGQGEKRLEQMRANPTRGWTINDVRVVCDAFGVPLLNPSSGSHYKVTHDTQRDILTIPHARPIKPIYIRRLVAFIDAVRDTRP